MSRRIASRLILLVAVGCGGSERAPVESPPTPRPAPPRTIVLVTVDTLRADRVGFNGYGAATTPFLDRLAAEGAVFDRAYATSSWTPPTMASLFTGTAPMTHGVVSGEIAPHRVLRQPVLPESLETIAELLRRQGYRTLGAASNPHLAGDLGFAQGFDRYFEPESFFPAKVLTDGMRELLRAELEAPGRAAARGGKLFLWLHYIDPHDPYTPYSPWIREHAPEAAAIGPRSPARKVMRQLRQLFPCPDAALAEAIRPYYDSEVRRVDDLFAELWRELGSDDDTLLVFTADHGEEMAEHGGLGHSQSLYEELVRVPLFLRWPAGIPAGTRSTAPVSTVDLLPTIAEIVGAAAPEGLPGRSLLGAARREKAAALPAFLELSPPKPFRWAMVDGHTKLVVDPTDGGRAELYDLRNDPHERDDLAASRPADVERMRQALRERARRLPRAPDQRVRERVDEELREQLEALGYLGGDGEPPPR